jgi:hypothetical protein
MKKLTYCRQKHDGYFAVQEGMPSLSLPFNLCPSFYDFFAQPKVKACPFLQGVVILLPVPLAVGCLGFVHRFHLQLVRP